MNTANDTHRKLVPIVENFENGVDEHLTITHCGTAKPDIASDEIDDVMSSIVVCRYRVTRRSASVYCLWYASY